MACFRPMVAHRDRVTGETALGYRLADTGDCLSLPCGRCVGCKLERASAWATRITHEASLYDSNLFVTLDYRPDALPASRSLEYEDFQRFMKRLRRRYRGVSAPRVEGVEFKAGFRPIRFFASGEYGDRFKRPHWHAILFNLVLPDAERYQNGTLRSEELEAIWGKGRCVIGEVTPASAAYVAGYTIKKAHGAAARAAAYDVVDERTGEVLFERRPEFCVMSRRPGIGAWWYDRFHRDLFPGGGESRAVVEGQERKVPRYYINRLIERDPLSAEEVAYVRFQRALEVPLEESSPQRLQVREEVARARQEFFSQRQQEF